MPPELAAPSARGIFFPFGLECLIQERDQLHGDRARPAKAFGRQSLDHRGSHGSVVDAPVIVEPSVFGLNHRLLQSRRDIWRGPVEPPPAPDPPSIHAGPLHADRAAENRISHKRPAPHDRKAGHVPPDRTREKKQEKQKSLFHGKPQ